MHHLCLLTTFHVYSIDFSGQEWQSHGFYRTPETCCSLSSSDYDDASDCIRGKLGRVGFSGDCSHC